MKGGYIDILCWQTCCYQYYFKNFSDDQASHWLRVTQFLTKFLIKWWKCVYEKASIFRSCKRNKKDCFKIPISFHFTQTCQDWLTWLWLVKKRKTFFVSLQLYGFNALVDDDLHRNILYFWNVLKIQKIQEPPRT